MATRTQAFTQSLQLLYKIVDVQPNWVLYLPLLLWKFPALCCEWEVMLRGVWAYRGGDSCRNCIPEKTLLDFLTELNDPMD